MSQLLEIVYASGGDDVIIPTLEIKHHTIREGALRICAGFEDTMARLEDGVEVVFEASGMDVSLPARNASGQQNLNFAIENVTGRAQRVVEDAIKAGGQIQIIYRTFLESDLSTPAEPPLKMVLVGAEFEGSAVHVTASYQDLINYGWPRDRYTVDFSPGLRYIG